MENLFLIGVHSVSFLAACNSENNKFNEQNEVDYNPVRYDYDTDQNENDRVNRPFTHNDNPDDTNGGMKRGYDNKYVAAFVQ